LLEFVGSARTSAAMVTIVIAMAGCISDPVGSGDGAPIDRRPVDWSNPTTLFDRHGRIAAGDRLYALGQSGSTSSDFRVRSSQDEGATWSDPTPIPGARNQDPYRGFVAEGATLHLVTRSASNHLLYHRSDDHGQTWREPVQITSSAADAASRRRYSLSVSGGVIHLVDSPSTVDEIPAWRSSDEGLTWTRQVISGGAAAQSHSVPVVAAEGNIVVAVWQADDPAEVTPGFPGRKRDIYYNRSEDAGVTWGPATRLRDVPGEASDRPDVAISDGVVVVTHSRGSTDFERPNHRHMVHRRSLDGGRTWQAEGLVAQAPSGRSYNHQVLGRGPGGLVNMVWMDQDGIAGAREANRALYAFSTDRGLTWSQPQVIATFAEDAVDQPIAAVTTSAHVHTLLGRSGQAATAQPTMFRRRIP
jgi:hypothetical protein